MCSRAMPPSLDTMGFADCALDDGVTFVDTLDGCDTRSLSIINCGPADDDLIRALRRMRDTSIRTVNLLAVN